MKGNKRVTIDSLFEPNCGRKNCRGHRAPIPKNNRSDPAVLYSTLIKNDPRNSTSTSESSLSKKRVKSQIYKPSPKERGQTLSLPVMHQRRELVKTARPYRNDSNERASSIQKLSTCREVKRYDTSHYLSSTTSPKCTRYPSHRLAIKQKRTTSPKFTGIVVRHLTPNVNKNHIIEIFSYFGKIIYVEMPRGVYPVSFIRGTAYIEYATQENCEMAIKQMDGAQIDGQVISISAVLKSKNCMSPRLLSLKRSPSKSSSSAQSSTTGSSTTRSSSTGSSSTQSSSTQSSSTGSSSGQSSSTVSSSDQSSPKRLSRKRQLSPRRIPSSRLLPNCPSPKRLSPRPSSTKRASQKQIFPIRCSKSTLLSMKCSPLKRSSTKPPSANRPALRLLSPRPCTAYRQPPRRLSPLKIRIEHLRTPPHCNRWKRECRSSLHNREHVHVY